MIAIGNYIGKFGGETASMIRTAYESRVEEDGGVVESLDCLQERVSNLKSLGLWDKASAVWLPHGYKEGKLYAAKGGAGADLAIVRAGTRTRKGPTYVEQVPYNYVTQSEDLNSGTGWTKVRCTITGGQSDPNSGSTAFLMAATDTSSVRRLAMASFITSGGTFTGVIYAKNNNKSDGTIQLLILHGSAGVEPRFNLNTGTYTGTAGTFGTATLDSQSITAVGNGWYKIVITATFPTVSGGIQLCIDLNDSGGTVGESVYLWRPQLVQGAVEKDYFKTTTRQNVPALDYTNDTCPALSLEPARTNLILHSSDVGNAYWVKAAGITVTTEQDTGPEGLITADKLTFSGAGTNFRAGAISVSPSTTYTVSWYAKQIDASGVSYNFYDATNATNFGGGPISYIGSLNTLNYVRMQVTFTTPVGCNSMYFYPANMNASTGSIYVWGFQLEAGSYATSYIPTTTATVSRIADSVSALYPKGTNLALYSEDLSNAIWVVGGGAGAVKATNTTTSPTGELTADQMTLAGTDPSLAFVRQRFTSLQAGTYTFSIWVKTDTGTKNFRLSRTNTVTWVGALVSTTLTATTEWQRFSFTFTTTSTEAADLIIGSENKTPFMANTGIYYLWGAQLEKGGVATTYLPTTTVPVHDGSVIGQTEGTLYFEGSVRLNGAQRNIIELSDGTTNNRIVMYITAGGLFAVYVNKTALGSVNTTVAGFVEGVTYKMAVTYSASKVALFVDGEKVSEDLSVDIPLCSTITFSRYDGLTDIFYGDRKCTLISPVALTDAQAIALTTP